MPDRDTEKTLSVATPTLRDHANLTLMNGPDAGCVYPVEEPEIIIGRDEDVAVHLEDASVSRRHARVFRNGTGIFVEDLGSTNGTFLAGQRIERAELVSGDRLQIGPSYTFRYAVTDEAEERLQRQLYESSTRDALTEAFNRKYLRERLGSEIAHARRHKSALAILLFDIDEFKRTNDVHGHLAGDAVLRAIADKVRTLIRLDDVFARYGGEEFVILIRAHGPQDASRLAERVRTEVAGISIRVPGEMLSVTVSVGVASLAELPEDAAGQELIAKADERLYRAKGGGRNRVISSDSSGPGA